MKLLAYTCKCGSNDFFIKEKDDTKTGLYCTSCGKWQKWINQNEARAYTQSITTSVPIGKSEIIEPEEVTQLKEKIHRYYEYCEKSIASEYSKMPLSVEDSIRKNAKCYQLELDKTALLNILEGREFNDNGEE